MKKWVIIGLVVGLGSVWAVRKYPAWRGNTEAATIDQRPRRR